MRIEVSVVKKVILGLLLALPMLATAQLNTDRITAIGRNALYYEDYVLSIQYFNQVIKVKPYLADPYLYRAIAKIQLGDYGGAEQDCNSAIKNSPFLPGAYYTRGFVYRMTEQYEKAERDFSEALVFSPDNKTYLLLRADVRAQRKDYEGALEDIDFLLKKEPKTASFHFEKGVILMNKEDTTGALVSFSEAVHYDEQNAANWSARGLTNSMLGNDEEALYDLTQAINLGSRWAGDYINRGVLQYKRHNYRGALSDYDKAIEINPRDGKCYYNRGLLRQELGDYNRALEDYDKALEFSPEEAEIHYQRGTVNLQLRQWKDAVADFDTLIATYPYFLPSYYLAAQAKTALGDTKGAFMYQQKASQLEKDKEKIQQAKKVNTDAQLAANQPQKRDRRKEFSNRAAQNKAEVTDASDNFQSEARGSVQKRYADVVNEPNIVLSYYGQTPTLRRTSYFHYAVEDYNRTNVLPSPLHFALIDMSLTAEMVSSHFDQIDLLSRQIDRVEEEKLKGERYADLYFARAVEFALVQDYNSAIDDCNKAIAIRSRFPIAIFCRANWRYKLLEFKREAGEPTTTEQLKMEFEVLLRDYDEVIHLLSDFAFAYYNRANMLCTQRDYAAAIQYYTDAIRVDGDFAEAYFNRGLTYIYTDQTEKGLADLSKAGELGIYQAYNLISRFK